VFGTGRFESLDNYHRAIDRCSCVARIGRSPETGVGSGFVLPGNLLSPKLGTQFVLLTNSHVISEDEGERKQGALHPTDAVVTFDALKGVSPKKALGVTKVLYSSPRTELDVVVAELKE